MDGVNDFFQTGAPFDDSDKPLLFCDSDWLIPYQRTDVAIDSMGQTWPFDDDGNLHPPSIEDIRAFFQ
jgi:hypothetical protein